MGAMTDVDKENWRESEVSREVAVIRTVKVRRKVVEDSLTELL